MQFVNKNSLKTPKMHFLPVFELMSDSLITIQVEPHQCPLHQSILHIQGPILKIFTKKKLRIGEALKMTFVQFLVFSFLIIGLFKKKFVLFFLNEKHQGGSYEVVFFSVLCNTMKAHANGSISRQYFFDTTYFHLLLGLRSFQKSEL